jgi:hypothetical protein
LVAGSIIWSSSMLKQLIEEFCCCGLQMFYLQVDDKMGTARMDLMFLVIFPCFFLAFNIVYWLSFLYIYPD